MAVLEPTRDDIDPSWELGENAEIDETLVVIAELGGGTRYEVFHAWDRMLFCEVAVKVLRPNRLQEEETLVDFEREASIAARSLHPNLVRMLRWNPTGPRPYLVFEYIREQTVADHLRAVGPVRVPETCLLGVRVLSALHYLHSQAVLHLDVKPGNVTMGRPRLLDFSLARTAPGPLKLEYSMGTPAYMPPEQCSHGYLTPKSDLFGLGATLYEAITGSRPFPSGDPSNKDRTKRYPQLVEEAVPAKELARMPAGLNALIMACLARDPQDRPRSALDAAMALERVLEELGTTDLLAWPKGLRVTR